MGTFEHRDTGRADRGTDKAAREPTRRQGGGLAGQEMLGKGRHWGQRSRGFS